MKKIMLSLVAVLTLAFMLITLNTGDIKVSALTESGFNYSVSGGEATVTGYTGSETEVIIPEMLGGYPVTVIGDRAFFNLDNITFITIPNTVKTIKFGAFQLCDNLFYAVIPDSVETIEYYAFDSCIGLAAVEIGSGASSIGEYTFWRCRNLMDITVSPENKTFYSDGNCIIEAATKRLIVGCNNSVIPKDKGIEIIGSRAFEDCTRLTSVTIPNTVKAIEGSAFAGCSRLAYLDIPDSVESIGDYAFKDCVSLRRISVGTGLKSTGIQAFTNCHSIEGVYIKDLEQWCGIAQSSNPLSSGAELYLNNRLVTSLVIPESSEEIKPYAFNGCTSIKTVTIPKGLKSIGDNAFGGCTALEGVYISDLKRWNGITFGLKTANPLTTAGKLYLNGELVTELTLPSDAVAVGKNAFNGCTSITLVVIPYGVNTIGESAFEGCVNLTSVLISDSVTDIGSNAFKNCSGLTDIALSANINSVGVDAFSGCSIKKASVDSKAIAYIPKAYLKEIVITGGDIPESAFAGNTVLKCVTIFGDVKSIGKSAFEGCNAIEKVDLSEGIEAIGEYAFKNCRSLKEIIIPAGVRSIGGYAFEYCYDLAKVELPEGLRTIDLYAFHYCEALTSVDIPDSVTAVGNGVFSNCEKLADIKLSKQMTAISGYMFGYCSSLVSLRIPDGVTAISSSAFNECTSLISVVMPNSVTSIKGYAFLNCDIFDRVYYLGTAEEFASINIESPYGTLMGADLIVLGKSEIMDFGDFDNDGIIDDFDYMVYFLSQGADSFDVMWDVNEDGITDVKDLIRLKKLAADPETADAAAAIDVAWLSKFLFSVEDCRKWVI